MPAHVVEGYWHNFYNNSVCPMRLTAVASYWDVIHVSFAENAGSGNVAFNLYTPRAGEPCSALDPAQFKADIQTLESQGKVVTISLGGAEGAITIGSDTEEANFVNSMKGIFTTWGFSGVDVDLEGGSQFLKDSEIQKRLGRRAAPATALEQLGDWYASQPSPLGGHMFLSMAPEHPYVHGGVSFFGSGSIYGSYLEMIDELRSRLDILHVQLYNNGSVTTPTAAPYNSQTFPVDSVDNLVASVKMLVEGFDTWNNSWHFNGINANQVAFGVPSGPSSSNPPYISTTTIKNAYNCVTANTNCGTLHMNANQPGFRGVMTWSINWDAYDVAHNTPGRVDFQNIKTHMGGGSCTPTTCSAQGKNCGSISNGCGGTLNCGSCTSPQTCGGGGTANVCGGGSSGSDLTEGGSSSGTGTACNSSSEDVTKLYDNQMTSGSFSKWCVLAAPSTSTPISTMYDFSGTTSYAVTSYTITTANDSAGRDPKDWTFQGCQGSCSAGSDTGWTTLDTRTGQFAGAARYQTTTFSISNSTAYQQYRLRVTANNGDGTFQVGELQMFGGSGSCTPTTCSAQGKNCGSISNGCGGTLNCGSCTSPQTCGGGGTANVCGGGSTGSNRATGGAASASNTGTCSGSSSEDVNKAYDGSMTSPSGTKWCASTGASTGTPLSTMYDFSGTTSYAITSYTITSGNDASTRDPKDWTFQGCNGSCAVGSDSGWTTLDTRTGQSFASRFQTNTYSFSNSTSYQQYRLRVTANAGGDTKTQMTEIQMFDGGSCTPTTCSAQGKNCGSISNGCGGTLNCGSCTSPQTCGGGGTANVCGGSGSLTFSATGLPLAIPDNTPGGVTKTIAVSGVTSSGSVTTTIDITHTYQGDLKLTLTGPGGASTVLWSQTGGGTDDIHLLNVDVTSIAGGRNGNWQLKVEDLAGADTGNLTNFTLKFN